MKKNNEVRLCLCLLISWVLFSSVPLPGAAAEEVLAKTPYQVPMVTAKVKVDGILDEKVWQEALVLELKYEVEPGENIAPPVKTEVLLAATTSHLYAAFRAYDPKPAAIRARVTDRDKIWNDDYVGIILDTFNDSRRAYTFYCNPFGIQAEKIIPSGDGGDQWDAIWGSAGRINEEGYAVEMAIPFSSLRFQRKKEDQVWGIDAVRSYPRNLSHLIGLFPRDRSNNCYLCQADKVIGFKGARPGLNIEFDPTLSGVLTQERQSFPDGQFEETNKKVEPGLTARWSFTPNLTLNATVNPDFSHVEADAALLDINTPFALFYPEKRPFFLEGASIFLTPFWAIYTRTIKDPDWGIKLTGKEGKNAIGFFSVRDSSTHLLFPSSQSSDMTSLNRYNISTVLRYYRDVGKSSILGLVVTDREGDDYFNRVAGIDGDIKFTKTDKIVFQYLGSQTRYPDQVVNDFAQPEEDFWGSAFAVIYRHTTQHVSLYAVYQDIAADFRADVGFVEQTDVRAVNIGGGYTWRRNPGHWFTRLGIEGGYLYETDRSKNLLDKGFQGSLYYSGPLQSSFNLNVNIGKRTFMAMEFDDNYLNFTARLRPTGDLYLGIYGVFGDRIDFSNIRAGERFLLNPFLQYNIGRHLYMGFDHVFERLNIEAGRLYLANISNLRLIYQFNRRAFLRTILQYVDYQYTPELYTFPRDPEYRHLFSQVLFSYKINPQTVLFLGYSDDYYGLSDIPLKQNNRTFFLKIGYALVL